MIKLLFWILLPIVAVYLCCYGAYHVGGVVGLVVAVMFFWPVRS